MKLLYLLRHGEARVCRKNETDIQRALTENGIRQIVRLGNRLREKQVTIDRILSSDAVRARQTAEQVARELSCSQDAIFFEHKLYTVTNAGQTLRLLHHVDDQPDSLLIVGHNPVIEELATLLSPSFSDKVPAGGLLGFSLTTDRWREVRSGMGNLLFSLLPE
jgi:phosphohistidine phosphatase